MMMLEAPGRPDEAPEVAEVSLLLPAAQLGAFEEEAYRRGLTPGQLLRRVLAAFLRRTQRRALRDRARTWG